MNRGYLRHTGARYNSSRANRSRADAHFNGVDAGINQFTCSIGCCYIAGNKVDVRITLLDLAHSVNHARGVAVRRIDYQAIDARTNQTGGTLAEVSSSADGSRYP